VIRDKAHLPQLTLPLEIQETATYDAGSGRSDLSSVKIS